MLERILHWFWTNLIARKALLRMASSALVSLIQYFFGWLEEQIQEDTQGTDD